MFGFMTKRLFFLSIRASSSLRVSSPMIPSNDFRPGRTKKFITLSLPMLEKNFPDIFSLMSISPPADCILKVLSVGFAFVANSGLIKFLFAPVSTKNLRILPSLVLYSRYGTLERLLS